MQVEQKDILQKISLVKDIILFLRVSEENIQKICISIDKSTNIPWKDEADYYMDVLLKELRNQLAELRDE